MTRHHRGVRSATPTTSSDGDASLPELKRQLDAVTSQRETLFKGETLRGLLLTSFGFSVFGVKGGEVASVAYIVAGLLALLSLAGFFHAARTSKDEAFAPPELSTRGVTGKDLAAV